MRFARFVRASSLALPLLGPLGAAAQVPEPAPAEPGLIGLEPGVIHSGIAALPDPSQTYELYLPSSFRPDREWPLLMVFDPRSRGRRAAEIFQPAAERWGWIVASSNNTMSDGPWDPNIRAVNAMWPDLMARLPVDLKRIYAAGFSGGAILSWIIGQKTGHLAGVVSVGGRMAEDYEGQAPVFASWIAAGRTDFNYNPTWELEELARKGERLHRFEVFEGPHSWFSAQEAERALAWLEVVAMREGRRPVDVEVARRLFEDDRSGAEAALASGDGLTAVRRLEAIAETYRGLVDVAAIEARARELRRDREVKRQLKDEKWGRSFEAATRRRLADALLQLREAPVPPSTGQLRSLLNVPGILAQASEPGLRGDGARRAAAILHVQLGFYLMRDLFAANEHLRAVPALEIAVELQPENSTTWYNLACARARAGRPEDALAALERSIEIGLPPWMRPPDQDPDLESLRERPEFARLVERSRGE